MIFLSRMKDEGIVIGDDIVITVKEIQDDKVQLNVDHPPGVPVKAGRVDNAIVRDVETSLQR